MTICLWSERVTNCPHRSWLSQWVPYELKRVWARFFVLCPYVYYKIGRFRHRWLPFSLEASEVTPKKNTHNNKIQNKWRLNAVFRKWWKWKQHAKDGFRSLTFRWTTSFVLIGVTSNRDKAYYSQFNVLWGLSHSRHEDTRCPWTSNKFLEIFWKFLDWPGNELVTLKKILLYTRASTKTATWTLERQAHQGQIRSKLRNRLSLSWNVTLRSKRL